MKIKVNRDNVYLTDDIYEYLKTYQMNNATYKKLIDMLKNKYFPNAAGNNVVWILTTEHYKRMCFHFTKRIKSQLGYSISLMLIPLSRAT